MRGEMLFDGCLILPTDADLTTATGEMPSTAGVCLLTNDQLQPVLLLYGANLRSIVRRRLTLETHDHQDESLPLSRRTRLRPMVTRIWFRRTYSPFETQWAYFRIAREVYPETYRDWFKHLDTWCLHLNSSGEYPVWEITCRLTNDTRSFWGPFPGRKAAVEFLEILQSLFRLCRCPDRIKQGRCAQSCMYAQMNGCGAMEQGTFSPEHYHASIRRAAQFLNDIPGHIRAWQDRMKQQSADLQFEQARNWKDRIALAQKLLAERYRWVMPLNTFYIVSFQPGAKIKSAGRRKEPTVTGLVITLWDIDQIESIPLSQALQAARTLLDHLHLKQWQIETSAPLEPSELFAWATQILYKKNRDRSLFLRDPDMQTPEQIAHRIRQHFAQPARANSKLQLDNFSLTEQKEEGLRKNEPDK